MNNIEYLRHILISSQPILFLGAGFSLEAKSFDGKFIPNGNELKTKIITEFFKFEEDQDEYSELIKLKLSEVCQYCANEKGSAKINDYLCHIFKNVEPAEFHYNIANYKWKKIYTTNIDDIIEKVYAKKSIEILVQNLKRKNTYSTNDILEYVKLHGCVNNPSEGITFSSNEYIGSILNVQDYRFSSFSIDIYSENIIFIGSSYDEFNIDYYLELYKNAGYDSSRGRLLFVNPNPSLILESKLKKINALIIKWTAKEFFDFIGSNFSEAEEKKELKISMINYGYQDLSYIRSKFSENKHYVSKLYEGFEPSWYDVLSDKDFTDYRLIKEFNQFLSAVERYNVGIFSIYAKAYQGKTTALLRLGVELFNKGFSVYKFVGREIKVNVFINFAKNSEIENFAILFDNASYNYGAIKHLFYAFPKNKKLIIVTASRPMYHFSKRYTLLEANFYEYKMEDIIDRSYAIEIRDKLEKNGFLGELKSKSVEDQIENIYSNNDIMSLLFRLTFGSGFQKRLVKDLIPLIEKSSLAQDFLTSLAIFDKLDLPYYPKELLNTIYGSEAKNIQSKTENFIKETHKKDIKLRSGFLVNNILKNSPTEKIVKQIKEILIHISPQVDEDAHSYWNEIQANLIKEKLLRKLLRITPQDIRKLYDEIAGYYSNNYNYWIQLGKSEQKSMEFEKALNHFKQAEALRPSSYMVQHCIGGNYLKQANSKSDYSIAEVYFKEGEKILLKHIREREEYSVRAYSTHSYLFEKIKFIKKNKLKVTDTELEEMFHYLKLLIDKDPDDILAKQISNYFYKYLVSIHKTKIIKIEHYDLAHYQHLFKTYMLDIDDLLDDAMQ